MYWFFSKKDDPPEPFEVVEELPTKKDIASLKQRIRELENNQLNDFHNFKEMSIFLKKEVEKLKLQINEYKEINEPPPIIWDNYAEFTLPTFMDNETQTDFEKTIEDLYKINTGEGHIRIGETFEKSLDKTDSTLLKKVTTKGEGNCEPEIIKCFKEIEKKETFEKSLDKTDKPKKIRKSKRIQKRKKKENWKC